MPIAKFEDTNKDLSQFISKTMTIGSSSKLHDDYEQVPDFDLQDQISKRIQMRNINLNLLVFGNSLINKRSKTWKTLTPVQKELNTSDLLKKFPTVMKRPIIECSETLKMSIGWNSDIQNQYG